MNTVAQVGGGAGVLCGAGGRRVAAGEVGVLRVDRSGSFAPMLVLLLALALPFLLVIVTRTRLCELQGEINVTRAVWNKRWEKCKGLSVLLSY